MSDLHAEARRRSGYHNQRPERCFTPAYEIIGLIAEREWSAETGAPRPDTDAIGGGSDGGHDFVHEVWTADWGVATIKVDVKGVGNPGARYLLIDEGRVRPEVLYVLGLVDVPGQRVAAWLGYAHGHEVLGYPPRQWPGIFRNHCVPVAALHRVENLLARLV